MLSDTSYNGQTSKVLIVEDEADCREFMGLAFKCEGYDVELAEDGDKAVDILMERHHEFSAVWLDLLLPRKHGLAALKEIRAITKELPIFVTSAATSTLNIVDAMKAGATDFIGKPLSHEDLRKHMLDLAIVPRAMPVNAIPAGAPFHVPGTSKRMREIQCWVQRISESEAPVLILGETGTGKEVLARQIHATSPRSNRPFLKLNCAALPSELVESELFGYERGAFTGAFQRKVGMFELADRGTILLDEIGDMDYKLQSKLLQVLQDREFQRLGGKETVRVDVRVMAATHRNLERAIENETFREDLYYRLNVISVQLPPLRERREDVAALAQSFLRKYAGTNPPPPLTLSLQQALMQFDWPGNIRELENLIRRYTILRDPAELMRDLSNRSNGRALSFVPPVDSAPARSPAGIAPVAFPASNAEEQPSILHAVAKAKDYAEADAIIKALESTHWNRKRAASLLNIDYKALLYKMKKLNIGENRAAAANG